MDFPTVLGELLPFTQRVNDKECHLKLYLSHCTLNITLFLINMTGEKNDEDIIWDTKLCYPCTFRSRQLLGDFKEGGATLLKEHRKLYINKCLNTVKCLHELHSEQEILVTADSSTVLKPIGSTLLPFIYITPGKVVHLRFAFDASKQTYMKSFVVYYMLSYASTVFQVRDKTPFNSGFPKGTIMLRGEDSEEFWL